MFLYRKVCMLGVQSKVNVGSQIQLRELVPIKGEISNQYTRIHLVQVHLANL